MTCQKKLFLVMKGKDSTLTLVGYLPFDPVERISPKTQFDGVFKGLISNF